MKPLSHFVRVRNLSCFAANVRWQAIAYVAGKMSELDLKLPKGKTVDSIITSCVKRYDESTILERFKEHLKFLPNTGKKSPEAMRLFEPSYWIERAELTRIGTQLCMDLIHDVLKVYESLQLIQLCWDGSAQDFVYLKPHHMDPQSHSVRIRNLPRFAANIRKWAIAIVLKKIKAMQMKLPKKQRLNGIIASCAERYDETRILNAFTPYLVIVPAEGEQWKGAESHDGYRIERSDHAYPVG